MGLTENVDYLSLSQVVLTYEKLKPPDMLVVMDLNGEKVEGDLNPSSDTPTHIELIQSISRRSWWNRSYTFSLGNFMGTGRKKHSMHMEQHMLIISIGEIPCARSLTAE